MACAAKGRNNGGELSAAGVELTGGSGGNFLARQARLKGRGRATTGRVDLTGLLSDDVLVRVLERVPDARDLVRTGALSRRWRGLWTRVPALRFAFNTRREFFRLAAGAERFVAFVDDVLALRVAQREPGLEHLAISLIIEFYEISDEELQQLAPLSIGAAQGWIQHAVEHALKSFELEMSLRDGACRRSKVLSLDCLPSSAKLEAMRLDLGEALVRLPATAVFVSLKSLSLESMMIIKGTWHLLARLLSTACCPCLQKLRMRDLNLDDFEGMYDQLLPLEAAALSELSMEKMNLTDFLQLKTPNLHVLCMKACMMHTLSISAPRLEELLNDDDQIVDIINWRMPHLPHVTSLTVHVSLPKLHSIRAGISDILTQCSNLKYLRVHLDYPIYMLIRQEPFDQESDFFCHHPYDCKSQEISLAHLQDVELKGLIGTDCELWFMQSVLWSAREVQEVAIKLRGGDWTPCSWGRYSSYKWRPYIVCE
uniref:F-box domain-containing protein n=1 Tax=Setaria italica TaxID=4555 RepID=K3Y6Z1_SETIT